MNVLVTGASGNVGSHTVPALLEKGHRVSCLVLPDRAGRRLRRRFRDAEVVFGDVRERASVRAAVAGRDVVIHLAYVIPPLCLEEPAASREVNVDGMRNVVEACEEAPDPPRLLFTSSLDVFGHTTHLPPPRRVTDPISPTDEYTRHKIECEAMISGSSLTWCIVRLADVPPIALRAPHPIMFRIPLETRIEIIHPDDAGLALASAVSCDDVWGRVLLVGGGDGCCLTYREYLEGFLEVMGIGALPDEAFGSEPYCTDWLDTGESQALLRYQRSTFQDVLKQTGALMGWRRPLARILRPALRWWILRMSSTGRRP
ncbi:MAG: NAD(P)-dependent oxidoreductase [Deltaproteobacteria bacterium]|nr:NAD(P)-dependent oxidoreductase [Deltaproteobacteria bacterium]